MSNLFTHSLTNRLLSGALMIATGGLAATTATAQSGADKDSKTYPPAPQILVNGIEVQSDQSNAAAYPNTPVHTHHFSHEIMADPLAYARQVAEKPLNPRLGNTAQTIVKMAAMSEDLNRSLFQHFNADPVASQNLQAAAEAFARKTHHSADSVTIAEYEEPDRKVKNAIDARTSVKVVTTHLVDDDANLFKEKGLKAAGKIQRDFEALKLFAANAQKIEGIQVN